uniref:Uncharacterized protein n=1 Tax=Triticum urartu TaxID=4572 RepID=A0A8R7V386_TRIUA
RLLGAPPASSPSIPSSRSSGSAGSPPSRHLLHSRLRHLAIDCVAVEPSPASPSASPSSATPRPTPLLPSTTTVLTTPLSCQSNQTLEPRSETPPLTTTTTREVPTT